MMRRLLAFAAILVVTALAPRVAHAFVELNAFYLSDAQSAATSTTNSRMNIEACVGFSVDKGNRYLVGWGYNMMTASDGNGTTATYSSTQMGPRFVYSIDKNNEWTVGLAYYLVTSATYDDGAGGSFKWKGTALKFDFGYNFPASGNFLIGVRMNYSSASYTEQLVGSTTYSTIGYSRTSMYPSLYATYLF